MKWPLVNPRLFLGATTYRTIRNLSRFDENRKQGHGLMEIWLVLVALMVEGSSKTVLGRSRFGA